MRQLKSAIPSIFTLLNLFLGCVALVQIFTGNIELVPWIIFGSAIADFLDGFVARLLKTASEIGKQLDSLADMVSFGLVPGAILYQLFTIGGHGGFWPYLGFSVTLFSAIRLAKFNLDTRQTDDFIGLATPACTMFFVGLIFLLDDAQFEWDQLLLDRYFLLSISIIFSLLLIAEIPMFANKFKSYRFSDNRFRYSIIFLGVLLVILFKGSGLAMSILLYILANTFTYIMGLNKIENS